MRLVKGATFSKVDSFLHCIKSCLVFLDLLRQANGSVEVIILIVMIGLYEAV